MFYLIQWAVGKQIQIAFSMTHITGSSADQFLWKIDMTSQRILRLLPTTVNGNRAEMSMIGYSAKGKA